MTDDRRMDEALAALRDGYNAPPETPREEMWQAVRSGLLAAQDPAVVSLDAVRARRTPNRSFGWAVAAAAVLVMGIGIGRMTAPGVPMGAAGDAEDRGAVMAVAAAEHLGQSESFLTLVRADARAGSLDPEMVRWAEGLLGRTRMFMDASDPLEAPTMHELMEDLELVLAQIVTVAEGGGVDSGRTRTELDLALSGMADREVLTRIQAVSGPTLAGT